MTFVMYGVCLGAYFDGWSGRKRVCVLINFGAIGEWGESRF